jgi:hypothetical protein
MNLKLKFSFSFIFIKIFKKDYFLNIFHRFYFVLLVAISYNTGFINVYNESSLSLVKSFQAYSSCSPTILRHNIGSCLRIKQSPFTNEYVSTASYEELYAKNFQFL